MAWCLHAMEDDILMRFVAGDDEAVQLWLATLIRYRPGFSNTSNP